VTGTNGDEKLIKNKNHHKNKIKIGRE